MALIVLRVLIIVFTISSFEFH